MKVNNSATKGLPGQIDINEQFQRALHTMEGTRRSVFITGRAGTGKSTLLNYFREQTKKKIVVLAPTGVAAVNVRGQTIHSFFKFKPGVTTEQIRKVRGHDKSLYRELDTIVIDEVSMVRADLIDCVDSFLRLNGPDESLPFGGIQMVLIGDPYQLPPVTVSVEKEALHSIYQSPYFWDAHVFSQMDLDFIELDKVYRQRDDTFISLLNAIRNGTVTEEELSLLNRRYLPDFEPTPDQMYVHLTTTNTLADEINRKQLSLLKGTTYKFTGTVEGHFGSEYLPTATELHVKVGAQVMMLNNDASNRWVNGTIGRVERVISHPSRDAVIIVRLSNGEQAEVIPHKWEIIRYYSENGQLKSEVIGTFRQYPMMLAWAITIHKSQGKTFDRVIIDIGPGAFAHGQVYVALSRCTSLEGIVLRRPIRKRDIWVDRRIADFLTKLQHRTFTGTKEEEKLVTIKRAIACGTTLEIVYLKPSNEKSLRRVLPLSVGEMEYEGNRFVGMRALCHLRHEERTFRLDRILDIKEVPS